MYKSEYYYLLLLSTLFLFSCSGKDLIECEEKIELSEIGILTNSIEFDFVQTKSEVTGEMEKDSIHKHFLNDRFIDRAEKYTLYVTYENNTEEYVYDKETGKWKPKNKTGLKYTINDGKTVLKFLLKFTAKEQKGEDKLFSLDNLVGTVELNKLSYTIDDVLLTHEKQLVVLSLPTYVYFANNEEYRLVENATYINSDNNFYTEYVLNADRRIETKLYYAFIPPDETVLNFQIHYNNIRLGEPELTDLSYTYDAKKFELNNFLLLKGEFHDESRFMYATISNLITHKVDYHILDVKNVVYDF
jgi:hypothetical protein